MSNSVEERLNALEALARSNSTALRRLPTVPDRKVTPYLPPALGTWIVTTIKYDAASSPTIGTDWDSWFDSQANYDKRWRSALPTRVGELHAIFQSATAAAWADNADHRRFFTAFDNNGPAYTARVLITCNITGHIYFKHNGFGTDYTPTARQEIEVNVQPGRNKITVQMQEPTSPVAQDYIGALQLEGVLMNPDQCVWRIGKPQGPFFSEQLGDDSGGGGGGGGGGIGIDTGDGGGGIG